MIVAIILLTGVSFLFGLVLRYEGGRGIGRWIERTVLGRLPTYAGLKSLTTGFAEAGKEGGFLPAVLISADGSRELAYVVEDYGDGQVTILLPWAPTPFAGSVRVVHSSQIELLDTNVGNVSRSLSRWGVGVCELLKKGKKRGHIQ